jgi:hypothetical protein
LRAGSRFRRQSSNLIDLMAALKKNLGAQAPAEKIAPNTAPNPQKNERNNHSYVPAMLAHGRDFLKTFQELVAMYKAS